MASENLFSQTIVADTQKINSLLLEVRQNLKNKNIEKAQILLNQCEEITDSLINTKKFDQTSLNETKTKILLRQAYVFSILRKDSLALKSIHEAQKVAKKQNLLNLFSDALFEKALFYEIRENYEKAFEYYYESFKIDTSTNKKQNIARSSMGLGSVYTELGNYNMAQKYYFKAISIYENSDEHKNLSSAYNNLGIIYEYLNQFEKALTYYRKSVHIDKINKNQNGLSIDYTNIGNVYQAQGNFHKAEKSYLKSLNIDKELKDTFGMGVDYINLAYSYFKIGNIAQAIEYNHKALYFLKKLENQKGLSISNHVFSEIFLQQEKFSKALKYGYQSLKHAETINSPEDIKNAYEAIASAYYGLKNYEKTIQFKDLSQALKDSLYNIEKFELIQDLELNYQTKKKEAEIIQAQKELELAESIVLKKKAQVVILLISLLLFATFLGVIWRLYYFKQKANKRLKQNKHKILVKNNELNHQYHEISAQRDEINQQKDLLEVKNNQLTDSIEYAQKIQTALLPLEENINKIFEKNFILFEPKNIVSGDFYWTTSQNHLDYLAVADCTGHGVPGAFMSLLSISYLNDILNNYIITNANECLNRLRGKIVKSLHQSGKMGETKDGLDIGLCIIDQEEKRISYAGAHISLIIIRNNEIIEYKADPRPIGIYSEIEEYQFRENVIQYEEGDMLYMFTDGIIDQFGGQSFKKFQKKQLKQLLLKINEEEVEFQHQKIAEIYHKWKGKNDQIDDVLVMGVKLK